MVWLPVVSVSGDQAAQKIWSPDLTTFEYNFQSIKSRVIRMGPAERCAGRQRSGDFQGFDTQL